MKKTTRSIALPLVLCILLIAAVWICTGCGAQQATGGNASETVTTVGEGAKTFRFEATGLDGKTAAYEVKTDEKTVGKALYALKLIDGEESAYGLYVKTVCGETVDFDKDGKFWAFYVNGEMTMTGADDTEIVDGAVYAFKAQ